MKKNVAGQYLDVQMINRADGNDFSGTITAKVSKDGAALSAITGTIALTETGNYKVSLSQADTNGDHLSFVFVGTGALTVTLQIDTDFPQTGDAFSRLGTPAGASISADIAVIDGIADTINANMALDGTVSKKADTDLLSTQASQDTGFLAGAKDSTVSKPGIAQTITPPATMALESSIQTAITNIGTKPSLAQIEASAILAKEATVLRILADQGNTFWVDVDRPNDTGDGLTLLTAKKTFAAAAALTVFGDTIKMVGRNDAYPYSIEVPAGVTLEGYAASDVWGTTKPIVNGVYNGNEPVVRLKSSATIRGVYIKKWFTQRIPSLIVMEENSTVAECQTYGSPIGSDQGVARVIDIGNITSGRIIDNELIGGSAIIDNAISASSGGAYKIIIANNRFDAFLSYHIDLSTSWLCSVFNNQFTGILAKAIKVTAKTTNSIVDNRCKSSDFILEATPALTGQENLIQNNCEWPSSDITDYFNKEVTSRTSQGNPKTYKIGTGANEKTITAEYQTIDGDERVLSETIN